MRLLLHFAFVAVLVVVVSCRKESSSVVKADSKLTPFVPPDSTVLASIDLDRIKQSPLYQKHEGLLNLPALNASSERIGLDLRRDLSKVLVAWQKSQTVTIATGHFSSATVQSHLLSLGAAKTDYKSRGVLIFDLGALYFPREDVVIAGPTSSVHAVIDNGNGRLPAPLAARLRLLPAADQLWMVSSGGLPLDQIPLSANAESALSNLVRFVTAVSLGVGIDSGAHLQAELTCVSPDGAKQVHDALRGAIGFARLTTRDDQLDLLHLYDAIHVDRENEAVHVRADLNAELADKLLTYLPTRGKGKTSH